MCLSLWDEYFTHTLTHIHTHTHMHGHAHTAHTHTRMDIYMIRYSMSQNSLGGMDHLVEVLSKNPEARTEEDLGEDCP